MDKIPVYLMLAMKDKYLVETLRVGSDELAFRVTSGETSGALLAVEVRLPPGGGPPMLHRHASTEVYRIERGELAIYLEDGAGEVDRLCASAGDVVHIPPAAHRTKRVARRRARVRHLRARSIERFLRVVGTLPTPSPAHVLATAERHGIETAGPVRAR